MKLLIAIILTHCASILTAQNYRPVDNASSVKFIIQNFGMATDGKFSGLQGDIKFNPTDLKGSSFTMSIDANTINTDIDVRDSALRTTAYLDTKMFPRINFNSKQITTAGKADMFFVKGIITIKEISKEISFPFKLINKDEGILLSGDFKISRRDFKIGIGSLVLSDAIIVSLSVFAKKN